MVIFVIERAPESLRGELTRWLLEVKPGVLIGSVNTSIREQLWDRITSLSLDALLVYSTNNEQGFDILSTGNPYRSVVEYDGLKLIKTLK